MKLKILIIGLLAIASLKSFTPLTEVCNLERLGEVCNFVEFKIVD